MLKLIKEKVAFSKYEKDWGSKTEVFIDTRLLNSDLKSKYNKIYIYSMVLIVGLVILNILVFKAELFTLGLMTVPVSLITLFFIVMKSESYIYISEEYEENYNYNLKKINENISLFKQIIVVNLFIATIQIVGSYLFIDKISFFTTFILISILLSFLATIFYMIKYYKINKKYEINKNNIADSGDFYDYISYNNPNDNRVFVADKIQMGMTINRGNSKGKLVFIGTYVLVIAIFVVLFYLMNQSKQSDYSYVIENEVLKIDSFGYDAKVDLNELEDIELKEFNEFPDAFKNNGVGTSKRSYGNWKVEGYGDVKLYSNNDIDWFIIIKTENNTYIFNDITKEKTESLYKDITNVTKGQ